MSILVSPKGLFAIILMGMLADETKVPRLETPSNVKLISTDLCFGI